MSLSPIITTAQPPPRFHNATLPPVTAPTEPITMSPHNTMPPPTTSAYRTVDIPPTAQPCNQTSFHRDAYALQQCISRKDIGCQWTRKGGGSHTATGECHGGVKCGLIRHYILFILFLLLGGSLQSSHHCLYVRWQSCLILEMVVAQPSFFCRCKVPGDCYDSCLIHVPWVTRVLE